MISSSCLLHLKYHLALFVLFVYFQVKSKAIWQVECLPFRIQRGWCCHMVILQINVKRILRVILCLLALSLSRSEIHVHTHSHAHTHTLVTYTQTHTHTHSHTHTHTHTYTHTQSYTHTRTNTHMMCLTCCNH